jgi:leader peptidase (prepilin peptidase) / N-methyltransferase
MTMSSSSVLVATLTPTGVGAGTLLDRAVHRVRQPRRLMLVQLTTGALYAGVGARFGWNAELPAYLYLVTVGIGLALIDFDLRRLPDSVVLPSYVITVVLLMPAGAQAATWQPGVRALAGMVALLALFFALAIAYPNGLTFGDVKLAGLIGLCLGWLSWNALFLTAIGSLLIAGVGGTAVLVTRSATRTSAVLIGPCLIGAALLALFVTTPISHWYASLLSA